MYGYIYIYKDGLIEDNIYYQPTNQPHINVYKLLQRTLLSSGLSGCSSETGITLLI